MKKLLCILAALMLALSSLTLTASAASDDAKPKKGKGEVNVYNWGEYIAPGDDGGMDVLAEFEKQTGIKVNYTNFETNEELYNVLTNSNSSYDVIIPSDYMVARLREEGRLLKINYDNVPNYKNIDDRFKKGDYDPTGEYSVAFTWGFVAMVYNTTMVDGDELTGFKDLWNPKYENDVLMFNNSRDAMAIAMQLCDPPIDPGSPHFSEDDIQRATDKLVELKECGSLKRYVMDQVFAEMEGDHTAMAAYYAGDIATMMDNNENLDYIIPEEGSNLFVDAMCIPDCCRNKENAEAFINFMCDSEVAAANAEYIYYGTPVKTALDLLDEDFTEFELLNPPDEFVDKCYTFTNLDDKTYAMMQENFIKACTGKASSASVGAVIAILGLVVVATLILFAFNIRRAVKNRGRINKI